MQAPDRYRRLYEALWWPRLKSALEQIPVLRRIYSGWSRTHPFDLAHGIDTSGYIPAAECAGDSGMAASISPYAGSQPSIIRTVLASLPHTSAYAFVDIGCGKGRPLVVASEFSFQRIVGVEWSPQIAALACANADVIAARHPERARIEIEVGDATIVRAPTTNVVFYMYHAFDRELVAALVSNLEQQLQAGLEHAFFVYYDPVHSAVFDQSPHFTRWSAQMLPYAADELGFGPDLEDAVVVWQSRPERHQARPGADRAVVVDGKNWCQLLD
ncbi:class I SAM-dependent methyltransferase [Sinimarinibacterium flocculans]|uniref:class I SAM-dependent methyltransferase n=1 Tax=Sinimarinibacterium flocculans TaxID=985250 RepID=UPI0024919D5E|nr:class I SAM-dependent methyltransferase [Sinimarinibacterium flocculans]